MERHAQLFLSPLCRTQLGLPSGLLSPSKQTFLSCPKRSLSSLWRNNHYLFLTAITFTGIFTYKTHPLHIWLHPDLQIDSQIRLEFYLFIHPCKFPSILPRPESTSSTCKELQGVLNFMKTKPWGMCMRMYPKTLDLEWKKVKWIRSGFFMWLHWIQSTILHRFNKLCVPVNLLQHNPKLIHNKSWSASTSGNVEQGSQCFKE